MLLARLLTVRLVEVGDQAAVFGADFSQRQLDCLQLEVGVFDRRHAGRQRHHRGIRLVALRPVFDLAPVAGNRMGRRFIGDAVDHHALQVVEVGLAAEHAADDFLDLAQRLLGRGERIFLRQLAQVAQVLLVGAVARYALDDVAIVGLRLDLALGKRELVQFEVLGQIDRRHELAVGLDELLDIKTVAHEAVQHAFAGAVCIRDHHALVAARTLILERDIRRGARQIVADEGIAAGLGGDDPVRALAIEQQQQLQHRGLAAPVAAGQHRAAMHRQLDDAARAERVDQDQAQQCIFIRMVMFGALGVLRRRRCFICCGHCGTHYCTSFNCLLPPNLPCASDPRGFAAANWMRARAARKSSP